MREQTSEILKQELAIGKKEHDEMIHAVPVLRRVFKRVKSMLLEEEEVNGDVGVRLGLFSAMNIINNEIKKLEGK